MTNSFARIIGDDKLPANLHGGVTAIGNFDGVHRGHLAVLDLALKKAQQLGVPATVLTFEPHPRALFQPNVVLPRITPPLMKAEILNALGFDAVIEVPFTHEFAQLSADDFIDVKLIQAIGVNAVVTGFDFHFGKKRQGGPAFLMAAGKERGFDVSLVDAFRDEDDEVISSSRIRAALKSADIAQANHLLGYRYRVQETIVEGEQLGRTLGYPTANMALPAETPLAHGIYAVRFKRADGRLYDGVASFGRRPTVAQDGAPLLETYVFDFEGDLYGEKCTIIFEQFLRGEEKFDGLEALTAQMNEDAHNARNILAEIEPLSELDANLNFVQASAL